MVDYDLGKVVGDKGDTGNGISSIELISTSGKVKTYRITFTDGDHFDYQVSDGADGSSGIADIVTSWSATLHDDKVPSEKLAKTSLDGKVDKVTGKGLSTNDFTNSYKSTIDGLSTVASSGSYNDLSNKPSIPSSSSDLSDGSSLVKTSNTTGLLKNDGSVMTSGTGASNWAVGNHTHSGYISTSSTTGLVKNDGSIDTNTYLTSSAITGMLTSSDIADNLTTNDSTKVLSAKQGYQLNQLIGQAISYINQ